MDNILNDEEVLNKYKDMSREEVLDLFGDEKALIQEELKNGTFSYDKLKEVCDKNSSSLVDARKMEILLTSRLTKCEAFNLFERDPAKQMEFASLEAIKEKAEAGMLTYDELNSLCDNISTSDAKNAAHNIMNNKIR